MLFIEARWGYIILFMYNVVIIVTSQVSEINLSDSVTVTDFKINWLTD